MRVINRSLSERGGNAASVHVVQVLVLLAVEDVVVNDLEASEARARRGPPMNARSLQRIRIHACLQDDRHKTSEWGTNRQRTVYRSNPALHEAQFEKN